MDAAYIGARLLEIGWEKGLCGHGGHGNASKAPKAPWTRSGTDASGGAFSTASCAQLPEASTEAGISGQHAAGALLVAHDFGDRKHGTKRTSEVGARTETREGHGPEWPRLQLQCCIWHTA